MAAVTNRNPAKRATNVSLRSDLLAQARTMGINLSAACERGLMEEIADQKARHWIADNAEAIESSNAYVEKHGLPLARFRRF